MNDVLSLSVFTPEQYIRAIRLSQNVFSEKTTIDVSNYQGIFAKTEETLSDIKLGVTSLYNSLAGSFAAAQLSHYSLNIISDPFWMCPKITISAKYFSSPKEINDLICVSAEIAELLVRKAKNPNDTFEKLCLFDKWVSRNFVYRNTCQMSDHTAIELLKKQSGVCQAIAAVAVLVLSYMGIKVLYVTGEGKGQDGWGPHAWNAVKINGRWIHVDFTFSMNSVSLPCTKSVFEEIAFNKTHRWNKKEFGEHSMDSKWKSINWYAGKRTVAEIDSKSCLISGVKIQFDKVLSLRSNGKGIVDFASIIRLFGGGMEINLKTGDVNICVCNKRHVIEDGVRYMNDGYFETSILNRRWDYEWCEGNKLRIAI